MTPSSPPSPSRSGATGPVTDADRAWLERAAELGRRGWGQVHPNPMVGCVLVRPESPGQPELLLGEGWHREWGGPHAEVEALAAARGAGHDPRGATAYVSLEPCNHQGKTPPCTMALESAGVARVVYGAPDPGAHSGGGGEALSRAGIPALGPLFDQARARRENPAFFHGFGPEGRRPWVVLKLAVSADGRIAARPGERTPISGPEASERVQWLRAGVDAIMVGGRTAAVDDPLLTVRGKVVPRVAPRRVILDPDGELAPGARVFHEGEGEVLHLVAEVAEEAVEGDAAVPADAIGVPEAVGAPEAAGAAGAGARFPATGTGDAVPGVPVRREALPLASRKEGGYSRFDLAQVMTRLRAHGITALLCEGGGHLASALLEADLVDRLVLVSAPRALGEAGVPALPGDWGHPTGVDAPWVSGAGWSVAEGPEEVGSDRWQAWDRERG